MAVQPTEPESMILFWTAFAAVAASLSAVVAAIYTAITYRLVRLQSDPQVIVYVRHDDDRPSIFVLIIENIGRAVASDVNFRADRPIPGRAYGMDAETAGTASPMSEGPLVDGIPALGPGTERVVNWGQFGGLSKALGLVPITLTYTYRNGRRTFTGSTQLEVRSFRENDASRKPTVRVIDALEGTQKQLAIGVAKLSIIAERLQAPVERKRP